MKEIPLFKLVAEPMTEEARTLPGFKWVRRDIGKRHQLGGAPTFLQSERWPKCPDCSNQMTFYGQLDSINDEFCIADCGLIYVFVCFDCNETKSLIQSS